MLGNQEKEVGSTERKNEIYSFEERAQILEDLNPDKKIIFDSFDEDGKVIGRAYTTYVYSNPRDLGGYLFFTEPNDGNKTARAVYVSDERMKTFLQDDEKVDDTKLREIAELYLEMSNREFSDEKFTYSFRHWTIENYRERINQVIGGIDSNSPNIKFDSKRIAKQIYLGEKQIKNITIKNAVSGVSSQQIEAAKAFLNVPVQQIDDSSKKTDEQGGQEV